MMAPESPPAAASPVAYRVTLQGVVQGVGFRPFVYREAVRTGVSGWVLNDEGGVDMHVQGDRAAVEEFLGSLVRQAPPGAVISRLQRRLTSPLRLTGFVIRESRSGARPTARISPDLAVCGDCLQELRLPDDRRRGYAYINCTNCGPRYSIILRLPYDRPATTMGEWDMCRACRREYEDPVDRRFHAQPTACPACGPGYYLVRSGRRLGAGGNAIQEAAALLRGGHILAVKGIGGYHLACDARQRGVVARLRRRKFRKEKPFALMVATPKEAEVWLRLESAHRELLNSVARPIVIATARRPLPEVAPHNPQLGVMLPYAPLHSLLFDAGAPSPLVLTSANRSSQPIAYRDDDAFRRLGGLADAFLVGERPIARRIDDSVVTVRLGKPVILRRARGYAPAPVCRLPTREPILALGADLKNAVALAVRGEVFLSQYIGELGNRDCNSAFSQTIDDLLSMYRVEREELTLVHDLHPQFVSTRYAETLPARRKIAVQHHRAHAASVLAEREAWDIPAVAMAFDGTGYGDDGGIWGGEVLVGNLREGLRRVAHLRQAWLPGGDAAARFPVQAAAGFLAQLDTLPDLSKHPFEFPPRFGQALTLVRKKVRSFPTTSMGRLFDCVAALCGFTREVTFEGQAAIWLEHRALQGRGEPYPFPDWDYVPLLQAVIEDRCRGRPVKAVARAFHEALAVTSVKTILDCCREFELSHVVLSGGVFQNGLLLAAIRNRLARVADSTSKPILWINRVVPPNDGGVALGQAALACLGRGKGVALVGSPPTQTT